MGVVKKYGLARTDTQANTPMNEEWKKKKKKGKNGPMII